MGSNVEDILRATIDGAEYTEPPKSRVESLLVELKEKIEEGGGGGGGTPQVKQLIYRIETTSGYIVYIRDDQFFQFFPISLSSYASELEGYNFHSITNVTPISDDPDGPDTMPSIVNAYFDKTSNQLRLWLGKVGPADEPCYISRKFHLSILFVKEDNIIS